MDAQDIFELRRSLGEAIDKQLTEKERPIAKAIVSVILGMAVDFGRMREALEAIAAAATKDAEK